MITIKCKVFNISQNKYDDIINQINISELTCPNCKHSDMIAHGDYKRSVKTPSGIITISIKRVKCKNCGKTHALLLSIFVPYSLITVNHHIRIINNQDVKGLMVDVSDIDESNVAYIKRMYRNHWKEKLISSDISFDDNDFIDKCFHHFNRQFMQIKCTINCLFCPTHIS